MKYILLPEKSEQLHYYRANLHCHSNISDGKKSPEQLKKDYMAHGYSAVAFTDHEVLIPHDDLTDESFVALNAFEMSVNDVPPADGSSHKTCHMCFVAKDPSNKTIICWNRERYVWGNARAWRDKVRFNDSEPDYIRVYSPEKINEIIRTGRENGFFVTYNHPIWSLEDYPQYSAYEGMDAIEMVNGSCVSVGYDEENGHCYDTLLRQGKRVFAVCTDDNHNAHPDDDPLCDSYGGYTMIAAPRLEYTALTDALSRGQFYASTGNYRHNGPEILSLVYENDVPGKDGQPTRRVTVKTSDAASVTLVTHTRSNGYAAAPEGETLNGASFTVKPGEKWFRLYVTDTRGYRAYTNAYFPDSIEAGQE